MLIWCISGLVMRLLPSIFFYDDNNEDDVDDWTVLPRKSP